ncbi:AAA+ family ATPase [Tabrizicola sp. L79]|uniref:AAA+ family ATPase n=1 Tax=Pseudotabrizicola sp. L79 TaxID=3118402 RepID=UPI002F93570B
MHKILALCLILSTPLAAQEAEAPAPGAPEDGAEDGFSLMEEGAKLLFRGLMSEMEPALDEMGKALSEMEPALKELMALVDDIRNYDAPRVLENGDILIPRRPDAPPPKLAPKLAPPADPLVDPLAGPQGEIEL